MASSVRVLETAVEVESTATPVTELPVPEPFPGHNRRFVPRVSGRFSALGRKKNRGGTYGSASVALQWLV
ncbi:MAG: hypothetical protein AAFX94_21990, partial [Myxococcota bacterium]